MSDGSGGDAGDGSPVDPVAANDRYHALFEIALVLGIFAANAILDLQGAGVPAALIVAGVSLWLRRTFRRPIGLSPPKNWITTILIAILLAVLLQAAFVVIAEPLLREFTGAPVDLSEFDSIRGNLPGFLLALGFAWTLAAFGEELLFRGYLMHRVVDLLGEGRASWMLSLIATSALFGVLHGYQGPSGMIAIGLVGFALGGIYLAMGRNLWLPILVHGFVDSASLYAVYRGFI